MDLETFLKQKTARTRREEAVLRSLREYCVKCLRPVQVCRCRFIKPFRTEVQFLILMHPKEAKKEKNGTGRLAHLHLKNSSILVGVDFSEDNSLDSLIKDPGYVSILLYPGKQARDITEFDFKSFLRGRKLRVLVIDGTWSTSKKMKKLNQNLHSFTQLSISPPQPSQFIIKKQPLKSCVSTIEAIYYFLEEWQKQGMEDLHGQHLKLIDSFRDMVNFQLECARNETLEGYRRNAL